MKEIFTEEEYQEAVKLYNEQVRMNFYSNKNLYSAYEGYVDLRDFEMPDTDFRLLWQVQDLLYNFDQPNNRPLKTQSTYENIKNIYHNCFREV